MSDRSVQDKQGYADLHTHTSASDGTNPPAVNVRLAWEAGLAAVAVTDHDTVAGLPEAIAEGERLGITVVPGVEISTVAGGQDIHVLGYYMDFHNPLFVERLGELRRTRDIRNEMMVARLNELGMNITMEEILSNVNKEDPDETVGRPHIADLLVKKGYAATMQEAFDRYLGKNGAAYVNPPRITPADAVRWIHEAGGCAVLAHPGLYQMDELVEEMVQGGFDGIEVYHSDHRPEDSAKYRMLAERYDLIQTGGSDYHGERNGVVFHAALGSSKVTIEAVTQLQNTRKHS
ncbi:PHP domain-containing protein [Paenibacillus gansuensis]|uniref:PHP domain-containing protein n=1 Tax=Paenibacillus gansuensis TaxID=306542 RepID=A0ABW5PCR5_9BACL